MLAKLSLLIVALLPAIASAQHSCDGSAKDVVDVNWIQVTSWGGHYDTTNNDPSHTVKVTYDFIGGGSLTLTLSPGQTQYPGLDQFHPLQSYKAPCHANYA
jgi:hypothetical protein